jgi:hypothetical protein
LGFLHSEQLGRPSLICDFQELYRYPIDDFLIERCHKLHKKEFVLVTDFMVHLKMGNKIHLKEFEADSLAEDLNTFFDRMVNIERIKIGNWQTIDTLRHEIKGWIPRLPNL